MNLARRIGRAYRELWRESRRLHAAKADVIAAAVDPLIRSDLLFCDSI